MRSCARSTLAAALLALLALLAGCGQASRARSGAQCSVLLVTLDTTRADHLGCYGDASAETPAIDRLAQEGTLFETAIAQTPTTLPSHTTILTSMWPFAHGVRDNGIFRLDERATTMADVFRGAGSRTGAVIASVALDRRYGLDQGFDTYDAVRLERRANEVTDRAIAFLDQEPSRPFLLWVHYYDPHAPYDPPAPWHDRFAERPYDGEIAFLDHELGRLIDHLRAQGRLDGTLVVVVGDHGESLGEHGENTHGYLVYDATLRVPLLLRGPGCAPARRVAGPVRLIDVMPTVLAAAGLATPAGAQGIDLRAACAKGDAIAGLSIYFETYTPFFNCGWSPLEGVRLGHEKYIRAPREELYDLAADPGEKHDLAAERPERVAAMRAALESVRSHGVPPSSLLADAIDVSEAEREKLAQLGYASSSGTPRPGGPDPKDVIDLLAVRNRGADELRAGHADEAIASLRAVLARTPGDAQARAFLGQALMAKHQWAEARSELERALRDRHSIFAAHYNLALCCRELGDQDTALSELQIAMTYDRESLPIAREIALLHAQRGEADEARAWLARCREIASDRRALEGIEAEVEGALAQARARKRPPP